MQREVALLTPENIYVRYRVAGLASRFLARLIDVLIQFLLLVVVNGLLLLVQKRLNVLHLGLADISDAIAALLVFAIVFVYAVFFEMLWGGRTPGKRLLGLRVVRDGGRPITLLASVIRNALLFVDLGILPPIYVVGFPAFLFLFLSPSCKRIGDYAAGTLVIVEEDLTLAANTQPTVSKEVERFMGVVKNLDRLTPEEYQLIRRFLARRETMSLAAFAGTADGLARPLLAKLEIDTPIYYQLQFAHLLEAIVRRYADERGLL